MTTAGEKKYRERKAAGRKARLACLFLVLILLLTAAAGFGLYKVVQLHPRKDSYRGSRSSAAPNDIDASSIQCVANAASLKDFLKQWSQNGGERMKSKYVSNTLLIGVDSDSKLSDSMILLSVNERTRQMSLVSFYRDSYTYLPRKNGGESYCKLNAAYAYGGAECVVKTIEDDYKTQIDHYVLVDYQTFPKVIDALGGVDVKVSKKEASYLNRTWKKWTRTHKKIQFHSGTMHMDGEHALMFCRIRKLDSDIGRTNRQRRVMNAILKKAKAADFQELNRLADVLQSDLKTDLTEPERDDLIARAWKNGWQTYPLHQLTMPDNKTGKSGYAGDQWIWIVDYEQAAHDLQKALYGQSNIKLSPERAKPLEM